MEWRYGGLIVLLLAVTSVLGRPTANVLSYYEPLNYDPSLLRSQHTRVARDESGRGTVRLHINAFNRSFVSSLSHAKGVFGKSVQFLVGGVETVDYDRLSFYSGVLEGEPKSSVRGHVIDGVFDGVIQTERGTFHVEKSHKFFSGPQDFHSIIYHTGDVTTPRASCGVKGQLIQRLQEMASHAVPLNDNRNMVYGKDKHSRIRRQLATTDRFCPVRIAADHLFLEHIGDGSVVNTMSEIVSIIASVQEIYRDTDFDGDESPDGIQPVVSSLEVLQQSDQGYRYGRADILVNDFLDLWSQEDQSMFCLALLLTYRDFDSGVLGLAWVAQPAGGQVGGICEDGVRLSAGLRYLNTAIVTFLNYGQTQPQSVSVVTIAHEFGHNFGSPHDPSGVCSPGGTRGNFIMFPQATDGSQTNNELFSSCSINSIRPVLETKASCFTATEAFCGNGILEDGEGCDCGTMCDEDVCCDGTSCTLVGGSNCSRTQACCMESCLFQPATFQCLALSECGEPSFCTGTSGACPAPEPRSGNVFCNNERNVCINGVCAGTICVQMNISDCQCSISAGNAESILCHVCCQSGGTCQSSFDLFGNEGQFREGGRSCNNFDGYCSNTNPPLCVLVDNEQTLDDLLDIFNLNTLNIIAAWLQVYWYVPVVIVVVIAILLVLLHITYRKRKPIKKGISRVRNSTLRRNSVNAPVPHPPRGGRSRGRPGQREISESEGERRLKQFFPTADHETMLSVMRSTRSESKAVKRMIDSGYPLQKVPLPRS